MSRWHATSCHSPKIYVEAGVPRCGNCHCSPDIEKLVAHQVTTSKPWDVPADEPWGALNLYWPPCVPYENLSESRQGLEEHPPRTPHMNRDDAARLNHTYGQSLGPESLRLANIFSATNSNDPIHIMLETYEDDDCPEYETVSYAWGGENNDYTRDKPVYVGEFWDILLQTSNCWNMLQYLRPSRGYRLIWVDAICINQEDTRERSVQVAKMGSIYSHSLRVVIYLGIENVHPPRNDWRFEPTEV